jgi:hypothetical protein
MQMIHNKCQAYSSIKDVLQKLNHALFIAEDHCSQASRGVK